MRKSIEKRGRPKSNVAISRRMFVVNNADMLTVSEIATALGVTKQRASKLCEELGVQALPHREYDKRRRVLDCHRQGMHNAKISAVTSVPAMTIGKWLKEYKLKPNLPPKRETSEEMKKLAHYLRSGLHADKIVELTGRKPASMRVAAHNLGFGFKNKIPYMLPKEV